MPHVLVVDDEVGVRNALSRGLRAEGMDVVCASDGPSGLREALTGTYDVILLDITLPDLSGHQVLKQLRAEGVDTPVLLVSAKDGEIDQTHGLDLGADGYLVKPFSFLVLVAQLRALLRRRETTHARLGRRLRVGELIVDPASKQASWGGCPVGLSPREFALLHALASRPHSVWSRDELLRAAWGHDRAATGNAVEVYIGYLRRKFADAGAADLVCTVRGEGYRIRAGS
jgi:DNA-binding response OmpR family regulator